MLARLFIEIGESKEVVLPTRSYNLAPRRTLVLAETPSNKNGQASNSPPVQRSNTSSILTTASGKTNAPKIVNQHNAILSAHPQDSEIAGSVKMR